MFLKDGDLAEVSIFIFLQSNLVARCFFRPEFAPRQETGRPRVSWPEARGAGFAPQGAMR
jgi:hypothetical protein